MTDEMNFTLKDDIPIPNPINKNKKGVPTSPFVKALLSLKVGGMMHIHPDSCDYAGDVSGRVSSVSTTYAGYKFTVRTLEDGVGIWRI